jgi:hypothetical protein
MIQNLLSLEAERITDVNSAVNLIVKGDKGWEHSYFPAHGTFLCLICGEFPVEHTHHLFESDDEPRIERVDTLQPPEAELLPINENSF